MKAKEFKGQVAYFIRNPGEWQEEEDEEYEEEGMASPSLKKNKNVSAIKKSTKKVAGK